jgi:putative ABC transport system substrate-binding protein
MSAGSAAEPFFAHRVEMFRQGLRDLGYVEGKDVAVEYRWADGHYDRMLAHAADLVRGDVDVIVTLATPATVAAKRATNTTPIVMAYVGDAVGQGLVQSLARPGGNITGHSYLFPELVTKRLELLKEILPKVTEVVVLWNPTNPAQQTALNALELAARSFMVQLHPMTARHRSEFESVFSAIAQKGADALVVLDDGLFVYHRAEIANLALQSRLPTAHGLRDEVDAGGLIAYGPSLSDLARRAAIFVDKILKGAKPGDLPVEQPTKFELVVNLRTAKALGLTIPPTLLARADEVIE